jgi:hypothetical protein
VLTSETWACRTARRIDDGLLACLENKPSSRKTVNRCPTSDRRGNGKIRQISELKWDLQNINRMNQKEQAFPEN